MDAERSKALRHFKKADPVMHSVAKSTNIEQRKAVTSNDYFWHLCYEIISQQLAGKAAHAICQRFKKLFPGGRITPEQTLKIKEKTMRKAGMSWAKASFVRDLARKVNDGTLDLKKLKQMDNAQAIEVLMQVKGIGPWTAEMFLMFTLQRQDVFSHGDLGLRKAIIKHYSLGKDAGREEIEEIARKWSPYRTYASRVLWKSLEV